MQANTLSRNCIYAVALIILIDLSGCAGNYGSFKRDEQVLQAFENNQLSTDFQYYYNGHHNLTYAILGIDPRYRLESQFWRKVEPNTEEFRELRSRIWEDYQRYTYGANLLDPAGNKVGVWFSSIYVASIKFYEDNHIEVMLNTPFLGGPDVLEDGDAWTP